MHADFWVATSALACMHTGYGVKKCTRLRCVCAFQPPGCLSSSSSTTVPREREHRARQVLKNTRTHARMLPAAHQARKQPETSGRGALQLPSPLPRTAPCGGCCRGNQPEGSAEGRRWGAHGSCCGWAPSRCPPRLCPGPSLRDRRLAEPPVGTHACGSHGSD